MPGTSVPSEQTFSKGGLIMDPFHNRLKPDYVNTLIYCQKTWSNFAFVKFFVTKSFWLNRDNIKYRDDSLRSSSDNIFDIAQPYDLDIFRFCNCCKWWWDLRNTNLSENMPYMILLGLLSKCTRFHRTTQQMFIWCYKYVLVIEHLLAHASLAGNWKLFVSLNYCFI